MKKSRIFTLGNIAILLFTIDVTDILWWVTFKSGLPFFIRVIFGIIFLFVLLFTIIIFVGFLIYAFKKKRKSFSSEHSGHLYDSGVL